MGNALRLLWTIWQNCCKCIPFKAQETFRTFREGKGFLPPCMNGFLLSTNVSFITALNHTKGRPLFICIKQNSLCYPPLLFSFVYWWHSLIMYNLPQGENSLSATKRQFTVYVLSYACTLKHPRFIVLKQTMMTSCSLLTPKVTWRFFPPPHLLVRCRVWEEIHCCELYDKMLHPPLTFSDWDIRRGLQVK